MPRNPNLDVPLTDVMRSEIAVPLRAMRIYTVGGFLKAWINPDCKEKIAQLFDTPGQAQHAATVCAGWLGLRVTYSTVPTPVTGWWRDDEPSHGRMAA